MHGIHFKLVSAATPLQSGSDSDVGFDYDIPAHVKSKLHRYVSPVIRSVGDLPTVPDAVGSREFAYGLTFNPRQLDEVCYAGYFPMSINVGIPVPAIKW